MESDLAMRKVLDQFSRIPNLDPCYEDYLQLIPIVGIVAFAIRCARRASSVTITPKLSREQLIAIDEALRVAERICRDESVGNAPPDAAARNAAERIRRTIEVPNSDEEDAPSNLQDAIDWVAGSAVSAAFAAANAASHVAESNKAVINDARRAAISAPRHGTLRF